MIKAYNIWNKKFVFNVAPTLCLNSDMIRVIRLWFRPTIRRNINGCRDITEYHFGFGFCTVRSA